MMGTLTTRQRQSKVTLGAGFPLASQVKTEICTSLLLLNRLCVSVRNNGLVVRGVATTLMGSASWFTCAKQTKSLSRKTLWPLVSVKPAPLTSRRVAPTQLLNGKKIPRQQVLPSL